MNIELRDASDLFTHLEYIIPVRTPPGDKVTLAAPQEMQIEDLRSIVKMYKKERPPPHWHSSPIEEFTVHHCSG